MTHISLWRQISKTKKEYPPLDRKIEVDVAIIGGGITGLTTALELIQSGKKVAVIEASSIGSGTTGDSTGNLYVAVQPYYQTILQKFDEDTVKVVAQSRQKAIDYIEKTVRELKMNCHFTRRPWYLYCNDEDNIDFFDEEVALLKRVGIPMENVNTIPLTKKFLKAAVMQNQARFNPLQYVIDLADYLSEKGCLIFEQSRILKIEEKEVDAHSKPKDSSKNNKNNKNNKNKKCIFKTEKGSVSAENGVIATHTPIGVNPIQLFTAAYRSYAVAVHLSDNQYPEGHFWNTEIPHYATCTHSVHGDKPEVLVVAGSHHKVGQSKNANAHFEELENYLKDNFAVSSKAFQWSAQHYHAADGVPYIGLMSHSENIYQATGYFADGLVYGTIAGIIFGKILQGEKKNAWLEVYDATRHDIAASAKFLMKENSNVFLQYMKDFPKFSDNDYQDLEIGEGKIVEINGEKFGIYRDQNANLHQVSAVCTHMKCIVNWNNAEKTWDCPCHGSRFSFDGQVLEGPAKLNLKVRKKAEKTGRNT